MPPPTTRALAALLFAVSLSAQPDRAFDHFYNLEYDEALALFEKDLARDPNDPARHTHVAQTLLFRELYRNGALESELVSGTNPFLRRPKVQTPPEIEKRFLDHVAAAIRLGEARVAANPKDVPALYATGIAYGLRGNYNFLVRKAWRDALRDATSGRKLHNRISEIDPANVDARLMQGLHDYIVGSLPLTWRMLGFVVGFRGDREEGIRVIERVAREGRDNRVDAEIFLGALYRREKRYADAARVVDDLVRRFPRNYLLRFEQGQMHSSAGDKDKALAALQDVMELKRRRVPGFARVPEAKIRYHLGVIQFWYWEFDAARENLAWVVESGGELDLNTGSYAWLRLAQTHDMQGRRDAALTAYRRAIAYAPESDAAREARKHLDRPFTRKR